MPRLHQHGDGSGLTLQLSIVEWIGLITMMAAPIIFAVRTDLRTQENTTNIDRLAKSVEVLADFSVRVAVIEQRVENAERTLNSHLTDNTIHHAGLERLRDRVIAIEKGK